MTKNQKIIENFKYYDEFLSHLDYKNKKILTSLKMMYAIHMENNNSSKNIIFVIKQMIRFIIKLLTLPFYKITFIEKKEKLKYVILSDTKIEEFIAKEMNISIIPLRKKMTMNLKLLVIYKELFKTIYLLMKDSNLNKRYILALIHRLIDYLIVYHTVTVDDIQVLFLENDRSPSNLALVHRLRESARKTVKYDNWLIDPINHNDVYCEYYYYPSMYHKKIIQSFSSNTELKYVKGGFPYWDNLLKYKNMKKNRVKHIIYFTQFGISVETHKNYLSDIRNCIKELGLKYEIVVKVHPRENSSIYKGLLKDLYVIGTCDDLYALIEGADYCFSIFSTISLEAKHIIENSFFINYDTDKFNIVDYDGLKLDVVIDKKMLNCVLKGEFVAVSQDEFIQYSNCQYPHSIENLKSFFCYD